MKKIINLFVLSMLIGSSTFSSFAWSKIHVKNCGNKKLTCLFKWVTARGLWNKAYRDIKSGEEFVWDATIGSRIAPLYSVSCGDKAKREEPLYKEGYSTLLVTYKNNKFHNGIKNCKHL